MKNNYTEITKKYQGAKFDSDPMRKGRIYAKATLPRRAARYNWAYVTGASFILFLGFFIGVFSYRLLPKKVQGGITCSVIETDRQNMVVSAQTAKSATVDLTEEDCAKVNTKYLLAQAMGQQKILLARAKDCPTADVPISSYDNKIIAAMEQEMAVSAKDSMSMRDMDKLKACTDKYHPKVKPLLLYKIAC